MKKNGRGNRPGWPLVLIFVALIALSGCAGDEDSGPGPEDGDLEWEGEGGETVSPPPADADLGSGPVPGGDPDAAEGGDETVAGDGESRPEDGDEDAEDVEGMEQAEGAGVLSLSSGDYALSVDPEALEIRLMRRGEILARFPADGFQLGKVDQIDDEYNYDPYYIAAREPAFPAPEGLAWLGITALSIQEADETLIVLALDFAGNKSATLTLTRRARGRFTASILPSEGGPDIAFIRLRPRVDREEAFYGLGEYYDDVNNRGKVRAMQLEAAAGFESGYNEAHVPVPFFIGTRGWGLFVENPCPAAFDVAAFEDDLVDIFYGTGPASTKGLLFHLFVDEHPLDVTRHYYEVTGYPLLPARWGLGPVIWRNENDDQEQVTGDVNTMRDLDLAASAYWIDRPYARDVNTFDFEPGKFPDPREMIDTIHDLGFRFALWHSPYIDPDSEHTQNLRRTAETNGYFPPVSGMIMSNWGEPIDFTNPEAYNWWQGLIGRYIKMGVEGFKLDYGEDVVPGIFGVRNKWLFHDGSDERSMHSRYQFLYHKVYAEMLPETGGFLLCRAGTYGDQVNVSVIWPGDLDATFHRRGEKLDPEDPKSKLAVGGLPAALIAGLSLGPSGFPFYGSDTGGYVNAPPDKEVFTRWFQVTALSTVMQIGTGSNDVAWEYNDANGFDDEMLGWYRIYTRLHLRLFPYEWTYAERLAVDGRPIQRALGLAYPELGVHPSDTFIFGDYLLAAPVVERGALMRDVILPPGRWIDWWDGSVYEGGRTITVDAPLDKLPLYMMEGGIVPLLRPSIDTMAPTTEPGRVDSYADTPGVLYPRIAAGPASAFVLFDGADIRQEKTDRGIELYSSDGDEFRYGVLFEVVAYGEAGPASVTDNGSKLSEAAGLAELEAAESGWFFDPANGASLYVKVPAGEHAVEVTSQ